MRTMDGRTDGIPCKLYTAATAHQDWEDPSFVFRLFSEQYMIGRELQIPKCNRHYIDSSPQYIVANALFVIKTAIQINWRHSTTHPHHTKTFNKIKEKKNREKLSFVRDTSYNFGLFFGCWLSAAKTHTHTHTFANAISWLNLARPSDIYTHTRRNDINIKEARFIYCVFFF
jgi:hypothetical protein